MNIGLRANIKSKLYTAHVGLLINFGIFQYQTAVTIITMTALTKHRYNRTWEENIKLIKLLLAVHKICVQNNYTETRVVTFVLKITMTTGINFKTCYTVFSREP